MSIGVPEEAPAPSAPPGVLSRRRVTLVLAVLAIEVVIFFVGLLIPLSDATRQAMFNQTSSQFGEVQTGSAAQLTGFIFTHNASIAYLEMIPVAGAVLFAVSVFSTGLAAQALVASQGYPVQLGAAIFVFPYSWVELTGYSVALVSGFMLLAAWRKRRLRQELRVFVLEGVSVAAILLVAAAMEAATVKISVTLGFALWLPTLLALGGVIVLAGRRRG